MCSYCHLDHTHRIFDDLESEVFELLFRALVSTVGEILVDVTLHYSLIF